MSARVFCLAAALALAGCSLDATPSGRGFGKKDAGGQDGGIAKLDASKPDAGKVDSGKPTPDAGVDAGHVVVKPKKDAGKPSDDGSTPTPDAGIDAGFDAGPPPTTPPFVITHFSGGGSSTSSHFVLHHSIGALRPTHSDAVPTGVSTSPNYRLSTGLAPVP